jgi:hypothetical protein
MAKTMYMRFNNHARLHVSRFGWSYRLDSRVFVKARDGDLAMLVACESPEDAELELKSISEQVDMIEAPEKNLGMPRRSGAVQVPFLSRYLRFSSHSRMHVSVYGSSHRDESRVIVNARDGEWAMAVPCEDAEHADLELMSIGEQIDALEAAGDPR